MWVLDAYYVILDEDYECIMWRLSEYNVGIRVWLYYVGIRCVIYEH